jgi:predicted MPP superfamily phosphohydrolase
VNFLSIFSLILLVYLIISLIWWMPVSRKVKTLLFLFFLLISQKYSLYQIFGTGAFNPSLPSGWMMLGEACYNVFLILLTLLVIKDFIWWIARGLQKLGMTIAWPLTSLQLKCLLIGLSVLAGPWGVYCALKVPDVKTVEIRMTHLDPAFDGYRIVHLTDLHIGQLLKRPWLEQVVVKTNALEADLILITGDMVEGNARKLHEEVAPYGWLRARDGVMAVTGNHEHYHGGVDWVARFEAMGIAMLENRHRTIRRGEAKLVVAGAADRAAARFGLPGPNVTTAIQNAPNVPVILMSHQPKGAEQLKGIDLQLSGHTHGGLIKWIQPLIALFNGGFVDGLYRANERTQVYVNPGTGLWTGMACRIGVPSEITQIVLRRDRPPF